MRFRKKYLFYFLAFSSAIITAGVSALDSSIASLFISNPWAFGFSCFIVGVLITFVIVLILSIKIRTRNLGSIMIDPSFKSIRFVRREELKYHLFAAFGNSVLTIGYLALLSMLGDPSVVLPFSQIVILYLIIIESLTEKNVPTLTEIQSSLIVTFGAILGSVSLTGNLSLESMLIVFFVINPAWVIFSIYSKKLKMLKIDEHQNDSLNIRLWNVVFSCIITALLILLVDLIIDTNHFLEGIIASIEQFKWLALTMFITFFGYVFYIRSLGIGKASVTQSVRASTVLFAIPFSFLLSYLNIIPPFSADPVLIIIKIIGTTLVILGILSFAFSLVKAYVFISVKPGYPVEETMKKLWNISGVTRVTACAGKYDFIVKIRIRTLIKGYEKIILKLNEIEAIDKYRWESVLKEWENI